MEDKISILKGSLNGNGAHDIPLIKETLDYYKTSQNYDKQVINELLMLLNKYFDEESIKNIENFKKELSLEIKDCTTKAFELVKTKKYKEAEEILEPIVDRTLRAIPKDNQSVQYYDIPNFIDSYLFEEYNADEIAKEQLPIHISELLLLYGVILEENKNFKDALNYLRIAYKYNPISSEIAIQLADCLKSLNKYNEMLSITIVGLYYAYTAEKLITLFKFLEFYLFEKGQFYSAYAICMIMRRLDSNEKHKKYINSHIEELQAYANMYFSSIEGFHLKALLSNFGINDNIFEILNSHISYLLSQKDTLSPKQQEEVEDAAFEMTNIMSVIDKVY